MNKKYNQVQFSVAFSLVLFPFVLLPVSAKPQKLVTFANNYRGLRPGKSTLKDAVAVLGHYASLKPTSNGRNYRFAKVVVNISGRDRVYINTISIDKDLGYATKSGVRLRQPITIARKRVARRTESEDYIFDTQHGIVFWHNGKRINKIVLVYQAYVS